MIGTKLNVKLIAILLFVYTQMNELSAQGVSKYGENTSVSPDFIDKNGRTGNVIKVNKKGDISIVWSCGSPITVNHVSGDVVPVSKTVIYGTVTSNLSGSNKCWITQNLGADNQATSVTDATDASAGWYWQFNRKRGYATGTIPAWVTITISENNNWLAANDPCTILLGTGWRIPTATEWTNADGSWSNYTNAYNSVLKIHAAGYLQYNSGVLNERGTSGYYWSSNRNNSTTGQNLTTKSTSSQMVNNTKTFGFSVRCIKN